MSAGMFKHSRKLANACTTLHYLGLRYEISNDIK